MQLNAQAIIALVSFLGGAVFSAGLRVGELRKAQRDINGVGVKNRAMLAFLIRWYGDDPEKREQLARIVEGK